MLGFRTEAGTLAFYRILVVLPAQKKKVTFGYDLFFLLCQLICQLGPDFFIYIYFFWNSGLCAVAAQGSKATVSVWGHVSGLPWGREDITEHDSVSVILSAAAAVL